VRSFEQLLKVLDSNVLWLFFLSTALTALVILLCLELCNGTIIITVFASMLNTAVRCVHVCGANHFLILFAISRISACSAATILS